MSKGPWGQITSRTRAPQPGSAIWPLWRAVMKVNTKLYRISGGRLFGRFDRAEMCVLHHRGRKSGEARETPLVFLRDGEDTIVVGSMGGSPKMPAWVHNLRAAPDAVTLEVRGRRTPVLAAEVDGAERDELWPRLLEIWPAWADYQLKTERRFPVFRLSAR